MRSCASKLTQSQAEELSASDYRQRNTGQEGINWNAIPILSCKFVACAPSMYAGIYNEARGAQRNESSKESKVIVAMH